MPEKVAISDYPPASAPSDTLDDITAELEHRLAVVESEEYRASTCYRMGNRILLETAIWLIVALFLGVSALASWL